MLYPMRDRSVKTIETAEELAQKLTQYNWCGCVGFRLRGYLFLNDSTGPDSAQEFAVVRESDMRQVESITFGWCRQDEALRYIQQSIAGEFDHVMSAPVDPKIIQTPDKHRCCHCA